jgi:hypothetical protein
MWTWGFGDHPVEGSDEQGGIIRKVAESCDAVDSESTGWSGMESECGVPAEAAKVTAYGHRWEGGTHHGLMPILIVDQAVDPKKRIRQY